MTASKTKAKSNPKQKFVINFNAAFILFATSFLRNVLRAVLLFIFYRDLIINYGPSQQALFTLSVTIATYANIVEAGVGSTIIISLYKHAKNHNYHTINRLLCGAKKVFRIITFIYIFCAVLIAIAFSLFLVPNGFYNPDYLTYFGMFVLVSCINIPGYLYGSKYDFLLSADIKSYVINTCNMIAMLITYVPIILVLAFPGITGQIPLLATVACFVAWFWFHNLFITIYARMKYKWLNLNVKPLFTFKRVLRSSSLYRIFMVLVTNIAPIMIIIFSTLTVKSGYDLYNQFAIGFSALFFSVIASALPAFHVQYKTTPKHHIKKVINHGFYIVNILATAISVTFFIMVNCSLNFWYGSIYTQPPINLNPYWEALLFSVLIFSSIYASYALEFCYLRGYFRRLMKLPIVLLVAELVTLITLLFVLQNKIIACVVSSIIVNIINFIWLSYACHRHLLRQRNTRYYIACLINTLIFGGLLTAGYFININIKALNDLQINFGTWLWIGLVTGILSLITSWICSTAWEYKKFIDISKGTMSTLKNLKWNRKNRFIPGTYS